MKIHDNGQGVMNGKLYIVLNIDTEGPATDPGHPDLLSNWAQIDMFLAKIFDSNYRKKVIDSYGRGVVFSWFMLSWTGFKTNPIKRDFGYHKVYDHYMLEWGNRIKKYGDGVYWHYHHPHSNGIGNAWSREWNSSNEYHNILNRFVIDRRYFPSVFRAGGTIETNEVSDWLEQWIPFDYSSRSNGIDWKKSDSSGHSLRDICDWSKAPKDWSWYHPSKHDYQMPGDMKRIIFRSIDLMTGVYTLQLSDITDAFERAKNGYNTIFSVFEHDYRDRAGQIYDKLLSPLEKVSRNYPSVKWQFANALEAAQSVMGLKKSQGPLFDLYLDDMRNLFIIKSDKRLFGKQPYVVFKYEDTGEYERIDTEEIDENKWTVPVNKGRDSVIGIAGSDIFGNPNVVLYELKDSKLTTIKHIQE